MKTRVLNLLSKMQELKVDAMLIGSKPNRMYLSGFTGSSGMLYISLKKQIIVTDFRYIEQASKQCESFEVISQGEIGLLKTVMKIAMEDGARYIGFESVHTNYATFLELNAYDFAQLVPTQSVVEDLRRIKDEVELKKLRQAEHIGDLAFQSIISFMKKEYSRGLSEREIASELEHFMRKQGASAVSFSPIVAAGPRSSLPHAEPGEDQIHQGDFIVLDFGCIYQGYCSDMTRTVVVGEPSKKHREIYDIVLRAQIEALKQIRPGLLGKEVDKVARDIIKEAGYEEYFGHGLGHSVGLEIHESPRFSPADTVKIQKGMVMTVEPGIYLPGFGGVRIEDLVVITEKGIDNLTYSPKELIVIA